MNGYYHPIFSKDYVSFFFTYDIDFFATHINAQLPAYVSWKPDPSALYTNASTMDWASKYFYTFPPFSIISRVLQKIQGDKTMAMVILPLWPTQVSFKTALHLFAVTPVLLP